jgi:hypothetical protein
MNNPTDDTAIHRAKVDSAISKFWSTLRQGASQILHNAPQAWTGPNARDYLYERDIIKRNYSCVMWGVWATCICFASFRLGANPRFQQYRSRLFSEWTTSGTRSRPSRTPKTTTTHTLSKEYKSPSDIQHEQLRDRLSQASSVPLDLFLSLLIGTSAATFLADFGQISNDFQNLRPQAAWTRCLSSRQGPSIISRACTLL